MYYTLCRSYRGHDESSKEKEAYKPSKAVMREHETSQFILSHYKGNRVSSNRPSDD